jgi:hypothetical protein
MLPDGLDAFFDVESFEKTDQIFRITLAEKNIIPGNLPERYRGKRVINTVLRPMTVDYFPLKGRKAEIILKRRWWQFEGGDIMLHRDIPVCAEGTKLEKEFADFLKEFNRE